MKRTAILLDESLERDLEILAQHQGRPKADLVRDALSRYVEAETSAGLARPRFLAIGRSGRSDTAELHEELIEREWAEYRHEPTR